MKQNIPEHRQDYGRKVSIAIVSNYTRNIRVYFNYMHENSLIKINPVQKIKTIGVKLGNKDITHIY